MGVSLQVLSNLHLELNDVMNFKNIITPCADVLALLGDIGSPMQTNLLYFLHWCSEHFKYVLYVPGNSEYYSHTGDNDMTTMNDCLSKICSRFENVFFLNNDTFTIEHKYMFIGSTLWADIPSQDKSDVTDYKYIYMTPGTLITHNDICQLYTTNKRWIEYQVSLAIDEGLIPIVLTHHHPFVKKANRTSLEYDVNQKTFVRRHNTIEPSSIKLWCTAHPENTHDYTEGYLLHSNRFMNISTLQHEFNYKHSLKLQL